MYFVCVEERRVLHVEVGVVPRVGAVLGGFAVGVAPVAAAPIAGDVRDTCVRDGCGKEVCACLQVLCHEAAVAGTHAAHLFRVYVCMLFQELLRTLDDVVARAFAPGVDVAGGKFLSVADGSAGVAHIDHVALSGQHLEGIVDFQHFRTGRTAAVVVDYQRIFLRCVKVGRQEVEAVDAVTARGAEVPVAAGADGHVAVEGFGVDFAHCFCLGRGRTELALIHLAGALTRLSEEYGRGLFLTQGDGIALQAADGQAEFLHLSRGGVQAEQALVAAVRSAEVDQTICGRALHASDRGQEVW